MGAKPPSSIRTLLEEFFQIFPDRKEEAEQLLLNRGISDPVEFSVDKPKAVHRLPCIGRNSRTLSKMLQERFAFAGTVVLGKEKWLDTKGMKLVASNPGFKSLHLSLREHWEGSAPMQFSDDKLSIFSATGSNPEEVTYLVWSGSDEPELWVYSGWDEHRFRDFGDYLEWLCAIK